MADLPRLYTSNIPLDVRSLFDTSFARVVKEDKSIKRTIKGLIKKYELEQSLFVDSVLGDCYERSINALENGKKIENIEAWIRSVARHCVQEAHRARCTERKKCLSLSDRPDLEFIDPTQSSSIDLEITRQAVVDLHESLNSLSTLEKKIVLLRANGQSFAQIAAQLVQEGDFENSETLHNTLSQKYNRAIKKARKKGINADIPP